MHSVAAPCSSRHPHKATGCPSHPVRTTEAFATRSPWRLRETTHCGCRLSSRPADPQGCAGSSQSTGPGQLDIGAQPLRSVLRLEVQLPQTLVLKVAKDKHLALI